MNYNCNISPPSGKVNKNLGNDILFPSHQTVNHGREECIRGNVATNTVEGYYGLLKRRIHGVYHHVSKEHFLRYLAELIDDHERAVSAIKNGEGKRLTYR